MERNNGASVAPIRQSSVDAVPFIRTPGVPAVAIAHVPAHVLEVHEHTHDFLVLFYAHRAAGTVLIDGRSWPVSVGDLFVITIGQVVSFVGEPEQIVDDGWAVWFPTDVIRPGTPGAYASWRAHPLLFPFAIGVDRAQRLRIPPASRAGWYDRFAALDAELSARGDGYREAALAHLTLLLVAMSRMATDVADTLRSTEEPLLAAVFDVIENRYHQQLSLSGVAAEVGLTPGHLTTVVRRKTGRTVQQWISERRMQQARLLLTGTDLTVAAVSRHVGYPDVSYFIKRFRAHHSLTPAQWRSRS